MNTAALQSERSSELVVGERGRPSIWALLVGAAVIAYVALFTAKTVAAYQSGGSLFDLACYVQGFANALGDQPFFYSLEGEMSRFGRHFSPFFYLLLPFWLVRPDPTTLLALQATAIGLGAVPVYLLARDRLGRPLGATFALAYLLNPAVADVNVKNDFHEISFALPTMLLALLFGLRGRPWLFGVALLLALSTREEVALTMALFGVYLAVFGGRRRLGLATVAACAVWFALVAGVAMPAFNAGASFPMADGYDYLGSSPAEVVRGALEHPRVVLAEFLRPEKLRYVFWLLAPLAFLSLLAPEVLAISGIALVEVLLSRHPYHFEIFERYAAPILPAVFLAAIVGAERLVRLSRRAPRVEPLLIALCLVVAVGASEAKLRKWSLEFRFAPEPHVVVALRTAALVPAEASVAVSDHRLLPHLAMRRLLYPITPEGPLADFAILDRKGAAVTHVPSDQLRRAEDRYLGNADYDVLRCEDGVILVARTTVASRTALLASAPSAEPIAIFAGGIRLDGVSVGSARVGQPLDVDLAWMATERVGKDHQVFAHLTGPDGRPLAQHDGGPQAGLCPTGIWTPGLAVADHHTLQLPPDLRPGVYELRIGLYELATQRRSVVVSAAGPAGPDHAVIQLEVLP